MPQPPRHALTRPITKAVAALCLAASLTGCGFQSDEPAATQGGSVRLIANAEVDTLDPQGTSWLVDFRAIECLYEPLLRVNPETLKLEPAAAQDMPAVSEDGLTYTFTIRPEAKWSNGDPLHASDFIYAWKRALLSDLAADYSGLFFCIEGAEDFFLWRIEQLASFPASGMTAQEHWEKTNQHFADTVGITAVDDRTLRVKLKQPTAYFNELAAFAAFMPVHEKSVSPYLVLDKNTAAVTNNTEYFRKPELLVGNGPYTLTSWRFKVQMVMDQSPTYWNKDAMGNTQVVFNVVDDSTNALLRYNRGEIDWYPNMPTADRSSSELVKSSRSDVHHGPAAGTYFYLFNCQPTINGKPNPLADARVRRALSMAVDRKLIVQNITQMNQPVAKSFVPPTAIPGYEPPVEAGASFDPAAAKKLLAEAGYPDGQGLTGLSILYNYEGAHGDVAQTIANLWKQHLNISVAIESVEKSAFRDRRRSQSFTIARGSWFGDYRDPTTFLDMFRKLDGNNDAKYDNPAYDQKLIDATLITDPVKRFDTLEETEAILLNDQPLMPLYHYTNLELFDPARVKNLYPNPWNYRAIDAIQIVDEE